MKVARWAFAVWTVGTAVLIAALPWAARHRLPDRLATHWGFDGSAPDGSMPLWAACVVPALIWLALCAGVEAARWRAGRDARAATRPWAVAVLPTVGVVIGGVQAAVVRANLDRTDWHQARLSAGWVVASAVAALLAGAGGWLVSTRQRPAGPATAGQDGHGPRLELPEGERVVWFSRTTNPWLHLLAAVTGLVAVAALVALVGGLAEPGPAWALFAPCALASLVVAGCASVQARVSEHGLEVSFGPLGWPVRRWTPDAVESARVENRTPTQVGGWGYRLSGLGTTVMLRAGECLVIRARGRRTDFALSVDDAERGAALLNTLRARQAR
ncbi:DUF1648 domain-containing protein [Streptomyces kebangsaanensis]|uniref:DUF1648 domain-containing protein n=1 Tax=Streptomyces kebangsaanensis TaxID=864058 RepID=UPI00093FA8B8|nr:DUF1648 domain-containing protein [Streptomyces kebangsaanensis]